MDCCSGEELKYDIAAPNDRDEIDELLLSNFEVPMFTAIGTTREDMASFIPGLVKRGVNGPLSLAVRNKESKIIAVQMASAHKRNGGAETHYEQVAWTERAAVLVKYLTALEENLWDLVPPDVNCLMCFEVTFVLPEYQRHGIGRRLSSMRLDVAKQLGCQGITTTSVSIKSQKLRISEGFQVINEIKYSDWLDENGKIVFVVKDDLTDRSILTFKRL